MKNDFQKGISDIDFDTINTKKFTPEERDAWEQSFGSKEISGSGVTVKEINAKDLYAFNWVKYKKQLDEKNERVEQRNNL